MLTLKQIDNNITSINQAYDRKIEELAMKVFDELVAPFCKKYKLRFIVTVGLWYFLETDSGEREICTKGYSLNVSPIIWHGDKLQELENVRETLSLLVTHASLGEFMPNYTGE